jgi:hypothetical protein
VKYVDANGEEGTLEVGEVPCGIGLMSVTMTYEDIADPHFIAWFFENIHNRFIAAVKSTH